MRRWRWILCVLAGMLLRAAPLLAQGAPDGGHESFMDNFPWAGDFVAAILGVALLCLLVYFLRPGSPAAADFSIHVEGDDVIFKGRFPGGAEAMVRDFLVNDCRIEESYVVSGKWEGQRLAVSVRGDQAKPLEQRIRNFLKLNLKPG